MKGITKRQQEILDYIQEFIQKNRYSPSYREVMEHFGFSSLGSVYKHIQLLKIKGKLEGANRRKRSLFIPEDLENISRSQAGSIELPLVGSISSTHHIELFAKPQSMVIPEFLVHMPEKTYVMRIQGDSFNEEFMTDHDLLIVEARQDALPGEVIIVMINQHDLMIKRFYLEDGFMRLEGYCKQHEPIILKEELVSIKGVVVGLIRQFL